MSTEASLDAKTWKRRIRKGRVLPVLFFLVLLVFYFSCLNYVDWHEVGIVRNRVTGNLWLQTHGGWYLTAPWVSVARIDTRPMRVSVPSAGHGYSSKLIQFDPVGWREFIQVEGFHYYWWANRFSLNLGYNEEYRGMRDIMRGHAYGTKKYSFIKVLTEYQ